MVSPRRSDTQAPVKTQQIRLWPVMAMLVLGVLWGYNWVVMKQGLADGASLWFAALRTILPALVLLALLPLLGRRLAPPPLGYTLTLGLLQTAGFVGFMVWALHDGAAGETAVLVFTMPLWLMLMAHLFLHEHLTPQKWLALLIAGVGLLFMIAPWKGHLQLGPSLFAVLSGVTWAAGSVWQKKFGYRIRVDLLNVTAWQMLYGGIALALIAPLIQPWQIDWTPTFIWALFYNVVPAGAIGWLLWIYALHNLPTHIAGFGALMIPSVGVFSAWLQLGERPDHPEMVGIFLILLALVLTVVRFGSVRR